MILKQLFGKKHNEGQGIPTVEKNESKHLPTVSTEESIGKKPSLISSIYFENAVMACASNDNIENRVQLYKELLFSDFMLVLNPASNPTPDENNPEINVSIFTNEENVKFAVAFSGSEMANNWNKDNAQFISIQGQDLFRMLEPSPAEVILINPGTQFFAVVTKQEVALLAKGVVPNNSRPNPVKTAQPSIQFPPDIFNPSQIEQISKALISNSSIEAAAVGALLPTGANPNNGWLRTLFLFTKNVEQNDQALQAYCLSIREEITKNSKEDFGSTTFEVGVMNDPAFWDAVSAQFKSNIVFDRRNK